MSYTGYMLVYFLIGFASCMYYITYKIMTVKVDDDIDEFGFLVLTIFFFWPFVIPTALFVRIQKKLKK